MDQSVHLRVPIPRAGSVCAEWPSEALVCQPCSVGLWAGPRVTMAPLADLIQSCLDLRRHGVRQRARV